MASSTQARTAYLYGVPIASESELGTLLNNRSQSDCSIHVDELKQGAAILKIFGSGLCHTVYHFCCFFNFVYFGLCALYICIFGFGK